MNQVSPTRIVSYFEVIDLEKMVPIQELMDLHRIERILIGKKGTERKVSVY